MTLQWNIAVPPPWNMKVMVAPSIQALSCQVLQGIVITLMVHLLMVLLPMEMMGTIIMIPRSVYMGWEGGGGDCIPPDFRPEEYVCMFLGVLLEKLFVDSNIYGRRKLSSKSACPDSDHHAWIDVMLEEMKAFLALL